jgi:hypothetical protein
MDTLYKTRAELARSGFDDPPRQEPYAAGFELGENAEPDEDALGLDRIPVKPGRELVEESRRGARCYRLEKTRCGKKTCRCARGELHGPYWYAYYRENGRMRCEYVGKNLPELVRLEDRTRKACKSAQAERETAAKLVAQIKETLKRAREIDQEPGEPEKPSWVAP